MTKTRTPKSKKKNIMKRPEFAKTIYLGSANKDVIQGVTQMFPDHKVYVMDAAMFGDVTDLFIKQHIKWREDKQMREYITKAENITSAHETANNILKAVGNGWFTVIQVVENTSFSHGQVRSILDLLYTFGLVVHDKTDPKKTIYTIVKNNFQKMEYVRNLKTSLEREAKDMQAIMEQIQKEIDSGEEGELQETKGEDSANKETDELKSGSNGNLKKV